MTKKEFDSLNIGDILTNKIFDETLNEERGYDYEVTDRTLKKIEIKDLEMGFFYTISRNKIEECENLRKK